jgi:hypothetical protein
MPPTHVARALTAAAPHAVEVTSCGGPHQPVPVSAPNGPGRQRLDARHLAGDHQGGATDSLGGSRGGCINDGRGWPSSCVLQTIGQAAISPEIRQAGTLYRAVTRAE